MPYKHLTLAKDVENAFGGRCEKEKSKMPQMAREAA